MQLDWLSDTDYAHLTDGREAPVIVGWSEQDYAESRLARYAMAARYLDDLPNRPRKGLEQA